MCDGALPVFRGKHLVVVGGGDTAAEEATFLTKYASRVTMVVRRDEMRASKAMQQRVFGNDTIEVAWNSVLSEVLGDDLVAGMRVTNVQTGSDSELEAGGLFFAIGHEPNTAFLAGQLETDQSGYLITPGNSTATSRPGVFACGDVQDKIYRQAVTAAGSGCMAAMESGTLPVGTRRPRVCRIQAASNPNAGKSQPIGETRTRYFAEIPRKSR